MTPSTYRERAVVFDGQDWSRQPSGLLLPPTYGSQRWRYGQAPIGISLFTGAGGFDLGFCEAGWQVVAASEWDASAAMTYLYNLGAPDCVLHFVTPEDEQRWNRAVADQERYERQQGVFTDFYRVGGNPHRASFLPAGHEGCEHFWLGDVRKLSGADLLAPLGLEPGDVDCVFGGPPCQGFSVAGRRDVMDPRNSLVFDFARIVLEIRPKTFVMENVPAIASMRTPEGTLVIDALARIFADGGFGTYEALKQTLLSTAGLGAGLRGSKGAKGSGRSRIETEGAPEESAEPSAVQTSLFEAAA